MKIAKLNFVLGMLVALSTTANAQDGEQLFKANCASCHTIGKGKLVGPDLQDVHSRHDQQWLEKWVKSSQTLVKAGDKQAVKLFNDNSKIPMPDIFINADQIKTVLAYIKTKTSENALAAAKPQTAQTSQANNSQTPSGFAAPSKESSNYFSMFSFSEYFLFGLCTLLLITIWMMSKTIRSLSIELQKKYKE